MLAPALASVAFLPACGLDDGGSTSVGVPQDPAEDFPANPAAASGSDTQKSCNPGRSDVRAGLTVASGSWGSWQACPDYCPANSFAYNVRIRSETGQGAGDDTAMNGIRMQCFDRNTGSYMGYIASHSGFWGDWLPIANSDPYTLANPWIGAQLRVEAPQGAGDDTAANTVLMKGMNGKNIMPESYTFYGSWGNMVVCPAGTAICGLNVRMEGTQGLGDDTALNGLSIQCCTF
jgi:hypothetical protein